MLTFSIYITYEIKFRGYKYSGNSNITPHIFTSYKALKRNVHNTYIYFNY